MESRKGDGFKPSYCLKCQKMKKIFCGKNFSNSSFERKIFLNKNLSHSSFVSEKEQREKKTPKKFLEEGKGVGSEDGYRFLPSGRKENDLFLVALFNNFDFEKF